MTVQVFISSNETEVNDLNASLHAYKQANVPGYNADQFSIVVQNGSEWGFPVDDCYNQLTPEQQAKVQNIDVTDQGWFPKPQE